MVLDALGAGGISSDESDTDDSGRPVYRTKNMVWRSKDILKKANGYRRRSQYDKRLREYKSRQSTSSSKTARQAGDIKKRDSRAAY